MKKLLVCFILCALLLPDSALAAQGEVALEPMPDYAGPIFDAFRSAWGGNMENAPAEVGGRYWDSKTKQVGVLLVNGGTEGTRQAVIALAGNAEWVSFKSCKYSYAQLQAVFDAMKEERKAPNHDGSVPAFYIDERANHVTLSVLKEAMETVGQRYKDRYGDMVHIEEGKPIPKTDGAKSGPGIPKTGDAASLSGVFLLALGCLCLGKKAGSRR